MSLQIEITDVENTIEREINSGLSQRQVAQTYALALRSSYPTNWKRVNEMILKRWPKGLNRIKQMAWSGKCFEHTGSSEPKQNS